MNRHIRSGIGVAVALLTVGALAAGAPVVANADSPLPRPVAASGVGLPPWPVPVDTARRAADAGLTLDTMEGAEQHFHVHLDILVGPDRVEVAPNLGIDRRTGLMADVHTHDNSGVLHVESHDANARFVLGQLFAMWNVRFDESHLGGLSPDAGHSFRTYVNGEWIKGDPARIELRAHDQISVMFQDDRLRITPPTSYDFPMGL
ncbi:hypothetical protein [Streptomyces sp. SID3343]|uniref:hypothetical protein n=1 Tax=Streptomyces sp. SID3343 TaxID=2690260 RepID=UPI00136DA6F9|nr:hypothetical protein [Streptomyces sp. SID3343]MYV97986.1 hypothetical protein [Streptomyces sp. SID3343]